ncbi:uncharacterized protein BKCO1_690003 [Diplodia corticola]|uniref:Uncharacterized protein n=1 Tax=Diplodia corticola TaxID=236234 RepID=A0A1J9RNA6_9PEZI|nr:uncharacterized protein BKCO1_690003 [Diplodia corticola]OJD29975.1 hypothetical protein BKCO1_690003 [Diplodia corticola]
MPPKPTPNPTNLTPSQISKLHFLAALRRYPALVPPALRPLDATRYDRIPAALSRRDDHDPVLSLPQLEQLVQWKLQHGTYRPTLLALVRSNAASVVEAASAEAFGLLSSSSSRRDEDGGEVRALRVLTKALRGVGPATASLVLACADPAGTPFFSDEVFRWVVWGEEEAKGKGKGWGRRIGYTEKEYGVLVGKVRGVVERVRGWGLGEGELGGMGEAVAVEKVAWVLGKEGVDCDRIVGEGEDLFDEQVERKGRKREAETEGEVGDAENMEGGKKTLNETTRKSKKAKVEKDVAVEYPRRQTRSSSRRNI